MPDPRDAVGSRNGDAGRGADRHGVGARRIGHDLDLFLPDVANLVLELGDRPVVGAAQVRDDVDAVLLHDHARIFAGVQRNGVAMLFAPVQAPLDALVDVERGRFLALRGHRPR